MRKKSGEPVKERTIRLTPEKMANADKLAKEELYTTFNSFVERLLDAAADYYEAEGELPTPFALVPRREMQAFREWREMAGLSVERAPTLQEQLKTMKEGRENDSKAI